MPMTSCALTLDGRAVGRLSWQAQGGRIHFVARCPMEAGYIYRVQLLAAGQTVNLGVMMPEEGPHGPAFVLRRALAPGRCPALTAEGPEPRAHIVRTLPGEEPTGLREGDLDRYRPVEAGFSTGDPGLDTAIARQGDVLYIIENNTLHLAYPLRLGGPTPFAPFLALSRWLETPQGGYGLIALPHNPAGPS